MKRVLVILTAFLFLVLPSTLPAQQQDQQQSMRVECRNLASTGNFLAPNETIMNGMACHPVATPAQPAASADPPSKPAPAPATSTSTAPAAAPAVNTAPAAATAVPQGIPEEPGMYVGAAGAYTKIFGQILEFRRSGSLLASDVTFHLKSAKENIQLLGPHAQTVTGSNPEFFFVPAKQEAEAGVNAGDFILVRLEEKKERRQIEIGAQGLGRASNGIALTHQIQLSRAEVKPGLYKLAPAVGLSRGEYGLYLARGEGMAAYIYDFSVQ